MGSVVFLDGGDERGDAVQAEARAWVMRLAEDPAVEADCAAWRAADPAHERAWKEVSAVWQQAPALASLDRKDWRAEIDALSRKPVRRWLQWGMAAAAAFAAMIGGTQLLEKPGMEAATRIAEVRQIELADGSHVTLGAKSGVKVSYESEKRQVMLDHGQAFFEVAHDRKRPFTVIAGDVDIRVTGTKFDVRRDGEGIQVSVLEGRVEVRRRGILSILTPGSPDRILTAGLRADFDPATGRFSAEQRAIVTPGDWRSGRLFYNEAPLSDIVADIQRYSTTAIRIDDPAIAGMKVTTSFRTNQIGAFLANLGAILPIESRRSADGAMIIEARRTAA